MTDLFAVFGVVFHDFGHVFGQQVMMLHRQHGQFQPNHAAHLTRPEASGVDDVFGQDQAFIGMKLPHPIGALLDVLDLAFFLDGRAVHLGAAGVGVSGA